MRKILAGLGVAGALFAGASAPALDKGPMAHDQAYLLDCALAHKLIGTKDAAEYIPTPCNGIVPIERDRDSSGVMHYRVVSSAYYQTLGQKGSGSAWVPAHEFGSVLGSFISKAHAAIAADSVDSTSGHTCNACTSLTYSFTNTAGNVLAVCSVTNDNAAPISGATYNGTNMSVAKHYNSVSTPTTDLVGFYLGSPSTGANNVVVSAASSQIGSGAISFSGADTTGASSDTQQGNSTANPLDGSLTSTSANEALVDCYVGNGTSSSEPTVSGSNVRIFNITTGRDRFSSYLLTGATGTQHLTWNNPDPNTFAFIIFGVKQAAGGGGGSTILDDDSFNVLAP